MSRSPGQDIRSPQWCADSASGIFWAYWLAWRRIIRHSRPTSPVAQPHLRELQSGIWLGGTHSADSQPTLSRMRVDAGLAVGLCSIRKLARMQVAEFDWIPDLAKAVGTYWRAQTRTARCEDTRLAGGHGGSQGPRPVTWRQRGPRVGQAHSARLRGWSEAAYTRCAPEQA